MLAERLAHHLQNVQGGDYWHELLPFKVVCKGAHQLPYAVLIWVQLTPLQMHQNVILRGSM